MNTFLLITNTSGCTYWSYIGHKGNTIGHDLKMVETYGIIFINRNGGFFPGDCIATVHKAVIQDEFPSEKEENI